MTQEPSAEPVLLSPQTRESLDLWVEELSHHLEVEGVPVEIDGIVDISDKADESVIDPAGPLTTFLIGYVTGVAEATGQADFATCRRAATRVAERLLERRRTAVG